MSVSDKNIVKIIDHKILKDFLASVQYPETKNPFKRLLATVRKKSNDKLKEDFQTKLPEFIESLRDQITGKYPTALTPRQLNAIIYERLSLHVTKNLGLSQAYIDEALKSLNYKIWQKQLKWQKGVLAFQESDLKTAIDSFCPPHLIDLNDTGKGSAETKEILVNNLQEVISFYQNKPDGGKDILAASLQKLAENSPSEKAKSYNAQFEKIQEEMNSALFKQHNARILKPKNSFTAFEAKAISIFLKQQTSDSISNHDKKLLAQFFTYAASNKRFNKRLGRIQKGVFFSNAEKSRIEQLYKFTHKTANLDKIYKKYWEAGLYVNKINR